MGFKIRHIPLLLASLLFLAFSAVWDRDIISRGEGREALVALSMLTSGNWILPSGYANDVPSKPPFLHWFISIFSLPAGEVSEVTARLPSVLAFISVVLILYQFTKSRFDKQVAFYSACILATSIEWYRTGVSCRVDALFSCMIFFGLLGFYKWYEKNYTGIPFAVIIFLSGAVLCKGPVAVLLPGLIFMIFMLVNRETFILVMKNLTIIFLPVVLVSFAWYLAAYQTGGQAFLDKVYAENVQRFLGSMDDEPHKHSAAYLLASVPLGFMPWTLIVVPVFIMLILKRGGLAGPSVQNKDFKMFSALSIAVFVIFFCIPSSKRGVYILPVYPFIAFYLGLFIKRVFDFSPGYLAKSAKAVNIISLVLMMVIVAAVVCHQQFQSLKFFEVPLNSYSLETIKMAYSVLNVAEWLLPFCLAVALVLFLFKKVEPMLNLFLVFVLLSSNIQYFIIRTHSNRLSPKPFAALLNQKLEPGGEYYSFFNEFYALSFYMKRKIFRLDPENIPPNAEIIAFREKLERIKGVLGEGIIILAESENYIEKPLDKLMVLKIKN